VGGPNLDLLDLDDALEELARIDERQSRLVELRFFAGLTLEETAEILQLSVATAKRDWVSAKAWLSRELQRRSPAHES
jgi:RNA polymerase sigma factor (sigma-70 family)